MVAPAARASTSAGVAHDVRGPRARIPARPPGREALRRNAEGVQLRRHGSYSEAAAEHRAALEILRALGDQRSVALTLNNLALTVSHDGDDTTAVALFEEAATILGELGDDQVEGQVWRTSASRTAVTAAAKRRTTCSSWR